MREFFLSLAPKAYQVIPSESRGVDIKRLYPKLDHQEPSYDRNSENARSEINTLIGYLQEFTKSRDFSDYDSALIRLEMYLCGDTPLANGLFNELKHALEYYIDACFKLYDKKQDEVVKGSLTLLKKHFIVCSEGEALDRGEYQCDEAGNFRPLRPGKPASASLAEHLRHAIPLFRIYDGADTEIALNFPAHLGPGFHRNQHTVTSKLFTQDQLWAFSHFFWQAVALIDQIEQLCDDPRIQYPKYELIPLLENAFLFFRRDSDAYSIMANKQDEIIVQSKIKLELIYIELRDKLASEDKNDHQTIKSVLRDLTVLRCADGYYEVLSDILDILQGERSKHFHLISALAEFRKSCIRQMAADHITHSHLESAKSREAYPLLREGDQIHLNRYYAELAEYSGVKVYLTQNESLHGDLEIMNLKRAFSTTDPFPRNNLNAKRDDLLLFKQRFKAYFHEVSVINNLAEKLDEYLVYLHGKYLRSYETQIEHDETSMYTLELELSNQFIQALEAQGLPEGTVEMGLLYQICFQPRVNPTDALKLRGAQDRLNSLKPLIIKLLDHTDCAKLSLIPNIYQRPVYGNYEITTVFLSVCNHLTPYANTAPTVWIPDYNRFQWGEYRTEGLSPISTYTLFLGAPSSSTPVTHRLILNQITSPSFIKEMINTFEQCIISAEDETEKQTLKLILNQTKEKLTSTKKYIHRLILEKDPLEQIKHFQPESCSELCDFLEKSFVHQRLIICYTFKQIQNFEILVRQGLSSTTDKPRILSCLTELADLLRFNFHETNKNSKFSRGYYSKQLLEILSYSADLIQAKDLPKSLRPYFNQKFARHFLKKPEDILALYGEGKLFAFTDIRKIDVFDHVIQLLTTTPTDTYVPNILLKKIYSAREEFKLRHNADLILNSTKETPPDTSLMLESLQDITNLFNEKSHIFKLKDDFFTLLSLTQSKKALKIIADELQNDESGTSIHNLLVLIHRVCYAQQDATPQHDLIVNVLGSMALSLEHAVLQLPLNRYSLIPKIYFLLSRDFIVDTYLESNIQNLNDWLHFAKIISIHLLSIPEGLLTLMNNHLAACEITLSDNLFTDLNPLLQEQIAVMFLEQDPDAACLLAPYCVSYPRLLDPILNKLPLNHWHEFLNVLPFKIELPVFSWICASTLQARREGLEEFSKSDPTLKTASFPTKWSYQTFTLHQLLFDAVSFSGDAYKPDYVQSLIKLYYTHRLETRHFPAPSPSQAASQHDSVTLKI